MKKLFYLCIAFVGMSASAQVGIGVPTADINASAQLEVSSTSKGFLAPRMTQAQKNNISSPAAGLLVYQTDAPSGFYYFDGSVWQSGLGPQGPQGATGPQGAQGVAGATGAQGPQGVPGVAGAIGAQGPAGLNGIDGVAGVPGPQGEMGPAGIDGVAGVPGPQGDMGPQGPQGEMGPAGIDGVAGVPGPQGDQGPMGTQGDMGPQGPQGETGPAGSNASITMGAISNSSSANGATIASGVLTLAPADANNGGVVTTGSQTFAGSKTFSSNVAIKNIKVGTGTGNTTNTAVGFNALTSTTTGGYNTALGNTTLTANTTGGSNIAIGAQTLYNNTTGSNNSALGVNSLNSNTTGGANTAIGRTSLYSNTTGAENASVGHYSLAYNTNGNKNTSIGVSTLGTNATGSNNTALGHSADVSTDGLTNATAIGYQAIVDASNKIQLGNANVTSVNTSATVTASGFKTQSGTSAQYLMADGSVSNGAGGNFVDLDNNQTINGNKYFSNNISVNNISIGNGNSNNASNTVFGNNALVSIQSGESNIAIGRDAAKSNNSGSSNVVIGNGANYYNDSSSDIVAIGVGSLHAEKGAGNVAIGSWAGHRGNISDDLTNSVFLGKNASAGGGAIDNSVALGNGATVDASNTIQLGNGGITSVKTSGTVTASGFKTQSGTSAQYLMADGSVSSGASSATHSIGESFGGGIVFYVTPDGMHGLIAAPVDSSTSLRWFGGSFTNTCARGDGFGAGLKNTAIIIANQGPVDGETFAARFCNEYSVTVGGVKYGDWYLPSKHELELLYLNKNVVGSFQNYWYCCSTEIDSVMTWFISFGNEGTITAGKSASGYARPIRTF